ncbi:hypothetical protein COV87_03065 [Candidatus Roizmanbacteria bacterium CG11_big_fil_rev_8_21_14_0_20_37_16]|uniref:Uncharacterized protein n=1 Tax=Candidatus Roizmanbacteria bacterium CG11_big_fil_rev_8_21_14_0_20_37_16 TaxID=1974857 RepID=A0A2H0KJS9_9BACT|nr:MAG: hypothetical protein COV87_03065 [Candidatus Roizmanbacteria bacterium CG11_big_fil_rev_8_21_14_0_20_37_16]
MAWARKGFNSPRVHSFEEFGLHRGWRSPAPSSYQALQSPVYIHKKNADDLKNSPNQLFWRRILIFRYLFRRF